MRPESFFRLRQRPCCGACLACEADLERKAKELWRTSCPRSRCGASTERSAGVVE